jgi:hypothetical protein
VSPKLTYAIVVIVLCLCFPPLLGLILGIAGVWAMWWFFYLLLQG